jgi:hypothetical protein
MLASTVQFSNNDQPPTTPTPCAEFTGTGTEDPGNKPARTLRHPTARPTQPVDVFRVPRRSSTDRTHPTHCAE